MRRIYVVVFSDKTEHFLEVQYHPETFSAKRICEDAVRAKKITTSRKNPQKILVELQSVEIIRGEQKRRNVGTFEIMPLCPTMTQDEYNAEIAEAVSDLPLEFQEFVRGIAWDQGHSAGYEEVVSIAKDIAGDLKPYVESYQKRIMKAFL